MAARMELFYDTETALRLVDDEVRAMTGGVPTASTDGAVMSDALEQLCDEVLTVLSAVRDGRVPAVDGVPPTAVIAGDQCRREIRLARELTDLEARLVLISQLLGPSSTPLPASTSDGRATEGGVARDELVRRSVLAGDVPAVH